ncbi:MAG: hypothetical protein DRG78_05230 [Epsilonproteobacteria bacterium]|nr:MAG: hypothetical protein DRG78_05230 [Campylobacterota bacterium]
MSKQHLKQFIGFGIAGNFAHHLEQAGEASDFVDVKVDDVNAPKGIFPFYLPKSESFLGTYPLSSHNINHPRSQDGNLQMEPEVALICEIKYENNKVVNITPNFFTAYNDCSIRKDNAKKISEKKNWGVETKGISSQIISIDKFEKGGCMDSFHIASFLKRDGIVYPYGEDSPVQTYNYFYGQLKDWIIEKLNNQKDNGPLEDLNIHLKNSKYPEGMVISIGATSYTEFGESTFLEIGDEIFVYVYDSNKYNFEEIFNHAKNDTKEELVGCSLLSQNII